MCREEMISYDAGDIVQRPKRRARGENKFAGAPSVTTAMTRSLLKVACGQCVSTTCLPCFCLSPVAFETAQPRRNRSRTRCVPPGLRTSFLRVTAHVDPASCSSFEDSEHMLDRRQWHSVAAVASEDSSGSRGAQMSAVQKIVMDLRQWMTNQGGDCWN